MYGQYVGIMDNFDLNVQSFQYLSQKAKHLYVDIFSTWNIFS